MTSQPVEQAVTKPKVTLERAHRIATYRALIALLPKRYGYARRIAEDLTRRGKTAHSGKYYNDLAIHSIIAQGTNDKQVEDELVRLVVGYTDKPIRELLPHYRPTYQ